eukprot:TRINITY_DN5471_c0_g1_i3.p1 TRINITY_DN5471_c0_g1~~TRINITY_DN5471_c0_g1_i3.p1  ORF type:complete len:284 (-),score=71.82 TRINITY_DN5471_c0_g1_i3:88-939(-)
MTKSDVAKRLEAFEAAERYEYKADAVFKMVEAKKRASGGRPHNVAVERDRKMKLLELALTKEGAEDEVEKLREEIAELDRWAAAFLTPKDHRVLHLAQMNKKNQLENFRLASVSVDTGNLKAGDAGHDPFSRRWTRSQNYYRAPRVTQELPDGVLAVEPTPEVALLEANLAQKEEALEKAKEAGEAAEVVTKLADDVATAGNELIDEKGDGGAGGALMAKHMFELPFSLEPLKRWESPQDAYMARKRMQEGTCGAPTGVVVGTRYGTTLSVNDYKRRRGLVDN